MQCTIQDLFTNQEKFDLDVLVKKQEKDPEYPLVSLFNLDEDPQESNNLAKEYPDLVRELLEEAEKLIEKAPRCGFVFAYEPTTKYLGNFKDTWHSL